MPFTPSSDAPASSTATPETRASRRAAAAAAAAASATAPAPAVLPAPSAAPRRRLALLGGAAIVGVALTAGLFQAPAALAALASAPTDAQIRQGSQVADDAGIALTNAVALNNVVAASELDVTQPAVEIEALKSEVKALDEPQELTTERLAALTSRATQKTRSVQVRTENLRNALVEAKDAEAARLAAEAAARVQAEKEAAAAALAAANTPEGAKATAREMAAGRYGWDSGQFSCLESLWTKESGWNYQAYNRDGGATGIPQALPGDKMAAAGADWRTSAATQIAWGLSYIDRAYGTPCSAWGHSQAMNWY